MIFGNELQDCRICKHNVCKKNFGEFQLAKVEDILTIGFQNFALPFCNIIDPSLLHLVGSTKKTLPACDWVCSHDGTATP